MPQLSQTPKGISQLAGLVIVLVIAILGVGGWYMYDRGQNKNANNGLITNISVVKYTNTDLGLAFDLPSGWGATEDHAFTADIVFEGATTDICGCAVYMTREDNISGMSVEEWLDSSAVKRDSYMTQKEYNRRSNENSALNSLFVGSFTQVSATLGGKAGIVQNYQSEGGGYLRYLVSHGSYIYALTMWSDSYYFSDVNKQNPLDGGKIKNEVETIIQSFRFLE